MPGLKDRLTDAGYGLGWSVVCRIPESWAQSAFRFFADLAWRRRGPAVQVLEGNLRRVIESQAPGGQLRGLSRQAMRSYARYWLEAFRLPVMPAGRLVAGMHDTGHLRAAFEYLAAGRGVIFALPHMGNYDLAACTRLMRPPDTHAESALGAHRRASVARRHGHASWSGLSALDEPYPPIGAARCSLAISILASQKACSVLPQEGPGPANVPARVSSCGCRAVG